MVMLCCVVLCALIEWEGRKEKERERRKERVVCSRNQQSKHRLNIVFIFLSALFKALFKMHRQIRCICDSSLATFAEDLC